MSPSIVPVQTRFSPKHRNANWTIGCNGDHTGCYPFLRKTIISQHTWAHFSWGCCCQKQPRPHGKDLILSHCYTFFHFTGMKKWFKGFKTIACSIELLFYSGKFCLVFQKYFDVQVINQIGPLFKQHISVGMIWDENFTLPKVWLLCPQKRKAWWHV